MVEKRGRGMNKCASVLIPLVGVAPHGSVCDGVCGGGGGGGGGRSDAGGMACFKDLMCCGR